MLEKRTKPAKYCCINGQNMAYCAQEPVSPLILSRYTNLFKLFASDVGLLASMYANGLQIQILQGEKDINFGAIYENVQVKDGRIFYCPIYMVGFLRREAEAEELLYSIDLSVLQ